MFLIILAVIGVGSVLYASHWGPWAFSDGVGYLVTARNLAEGKGLGLYRPSGNFVPTVTHPPLYPLLLALLTQLTSDVLQAARVVGATLIAVVVVAVPLLFKRVVGRRSLAAAAGLLLVTHPGMILMFVSAMSEPLFIVLGTCSLLTICHYLASPATRTLLMAGALAALAMLTRYVGLAYIITGGLALLVLDHHGSRRQRLLRSAGYSFGAILPTLGFLIYWMQTPYGRTVRQFELPADLGPNLGLFVSRTAQALWSWKPVPTPAVLSVITRTPGSLMGLAAALILSLGALTWIARWLRLDYSANKPGRPRNGHNNPRRLPQVFGLFTIVFLGGMLLAFVFSQPTPDIDYRTLFPLLPTLLVFGAGVADPPLTSARSGIRPWLAVAVLAAVTIGALPTTLDIVTGLHRTGLGYTARLWHQAETMGQVGGLDPEHLLVSNSPEAIMLHTGRSVYPLPAADIVRPSSIEAVINADLADLDRLLCNRDAYLVIFMPSLDGIDEAVSLDQLSGTLSCEVEPVWQSPDGAIYQMAATR